MFIKKIKFIEQPELSFTGLKWRETRTILGKIPTKDNKDFIFSDRFPSPLSINTDEESRKRLYFTEYSVVTALLSTTWNPSFMALNLESR